jgi:hypothetical protein
MTTYAEDRALGAKAYRDGLPYDDTQSPGWCLGYGDAISIEPCDPPADDE